MKWVISMSLILAQSVLATTWKLGDQVKGSYIVEKIERDREGSFMIQWRSEAAISSPERILVLKTKESHMEVEQGKVMQISAVVESVAKDKLHVMQVKIHLDSRDPIWLLSEKGKQHPIQGSSYLKMHAPRSDYQVL